MVFHPRFSCLSPLNWQPGLHLLLPHTVLQFSDVQGFFSIRREEEKWSVPHTLSICEHWQRMWMLEDTVVTSPSCSPASAVIKDSPHTQCGGEWAEEAHTGLVVQGTGASVLSANSVCTVRYVHNHCVAYITILLMQNHPWMARNSLINVTNPEIRLQHSNQEWLTGAQLISILQNPHLKPIKSWNTIFPVSSFSPLLLCCWQKWIPHAQSVGGLLFCSPMGAHATTAVLVFSNQNMQKKKKKNEGSWRKMRIDVRLKLWLWYIHFCGAAKVLLIHKTFKLWENQAAKPPRITVAEDPHIDHACCHRNWCAWIYRSSYVLVILI